MSRLDKLKRLKDEIGRLFNEGLDEKAVYDQLRTGEQFADANPKQVQAFYSNLQEESNAEAENKRQIEEKDRQIAECQQLLAHLHQNSANERQIEGHERLLAREQQMKIEMEFMSNYQQNANNFLLYDDESFVEWDRVKTFWQERFLMTEKDPYSTSDVHIIKIQDLFQDMSKTFTIAIVGYFRDIHALKFPFVLLHEFDYSNRVSYLRLVKFDFESENLQIVQSLEFIGYCYVSVNASDTSKFLLQKGDDVNQCKLIGNQIQIGRRLALEPNFNIYHGSYCGKQVCSLKFRPSHDNQFGNRQLSQVKIWLYNLERNEHSAQDIDSTPESCYCFDPKNSCNSAWIRDTIFVKVAFSLPEKYGIIFTNSQIRNWKFIDFATNLEIEYIQSFADGTLMVSSESEEQGKRKIYKLQMRKPDFLHNMAWIAMIKLFKEARIKNSYEEARQSLPLNSELQPFVLTED